MQAPGYPKVVLSGAMCYPRCFIERVCKSQSRATKVYNPKREKFNEIVFLTSIVGRKKIVKQFKCLKQEVNSRVNNRGE